MINAELICLIAGLFISGLVQLFKNWAFVQNHTKLVAMGLSIIISVVGNLTLWEMDWQGIAACILIPFSAAIATYEVAKDSTKKTA